MDARNHRAKHCRSEDGIPKMKCQPIKSCCEACEVGHISKCRKQKHGGSVAYSHLFSLLMVQGSILRTPVNVPFNVSILLDATMPILICFHPNPFPQKLLSPSITTGFTQDVKQDSALTTQREELLHACVSRQETTTDSDKGPRHTDDRCTHCHTLTTGALSVTH